jgi:hypothetical protein
MFNWGKYYEELIQVCENMELSMKNLTNFQTTRFAASGFYSLIYVRTTQLYDKVLPMSLQTKTPVSMPTNERKQVKQKQSIDQLIHGHFAFAYPDAQIYTT